jgi:glutathione synthase/RimK-type ligase-like ATP-grasp enzyme
VIPVETLAGLVAVLELGEGRVPLVAKRIVGAVHYRVFVVGQRAVGCYKNLPAPDGFRTVPSLDPVDHSGDVPEPIARAAVDACRALRLRFGGADILVRGEEVYVLEVNNPAWFGHMIGIDIARLLLEELFQLKIS